jgi:hypothetical protein
MLKSLRSRAELPTRMKLEDIETVAELADKRRELMSRRESFQEAQQLELRTQRDRSSIVLATGYQMSDDDENAVLYFAALRQATTDYFGREIAAIEEALRHMGVEP